MIVVVFFIMLLVVAAIKTQRCDYGRFCGKKCVDPAIIRNPITGEFYCQYHWDRHYGLGWKKRGYGNPNSMHGIAYPPTIADDYRDNPNFFPPLNL